MDRRMCHNCTGNMYPDGDGWKCSACGVRVNAEGRHYFPKPIMTNADKIRAMTDEELADWLARTQIANVAEALSIAGFPWKMGSELYDGTKMEHLEWLKQPAEEP